MNIVNKVYSKFCVLGCGIGNVPENSYCNCCPKKTSSHTISKVMSSAVRKGNLNAYVMKDILAFITDFSGEYIIELINSYIFKTLSDFKDVMPCTPSYYFRGLDTEIDIIMSFDIYLLSNENVCNIVSQVNPIIMRVPQEHIGKSDEYLSEIMPNIFLNKLRYLSHLRVSFIAEKDNKPYIVTKVHLSSFVEIFCVFKSDEEIYDLIDEDNNFISSINMDMLIFN